MLRDEEGIVAHLRELDAFLCYSGVRRHTVRKGHLVKSLSKVAISAIEC